MVEEDTLEQTQPDTAGKACRPGGVLFLRARTSLHPGAGTSVGAVDLPIQRERHTDWPLIQSSSIKGVLRDHYRLYLIENGSAQTRAEAENNLELEVLFGPSKGGKNDQYAGSAGFSDARILAFPLRSARGVFAWATCPAVIERLIADLEMLGATLPFDRVVLSDEDSVSLGNGAYDTLKITIDGAERGILLEDLLFPKRLPDPNSGKFASWCANRIFGLEQNSQTFLDPNKRLVVIPDDAFTHAVKHCTEVATRIALDYEKKTVTRHMLFTQELLPPETLMYSLVLPAKPRKTDSLKTPQDVFKKLKEALDKEPLIQIGADETTGKGWCDLVIKSATGLQQRLEGESA